MKTNKRISIVLAILLVIFLIVFFINKPKTSKQGLSESSPTSTTQEQTYLIEGFPIDTVPLYRLNKVSSNKIFVNIDPKNKSEFDETNFAYFNVVFYSDASQEEFLNYYKSLFESHITDEYENKNMVKGKIGQYKVSAAHYGSDNTGYVQVHVPDYRDESVQKYFSDFPKSIEMDSGLIEHEKSYGLLNQNDGEIEYTKYFTVIDSGDKNNDGKDDVDEFLVLQEKYQQQYKEKPEYLFDEKNGTMKWIDGDFQSTLSLSRDHGRIYVMLRKRI